MPVVSDLRKDFAFQAAAQTTIGKSGHLPPTILEYAAGEQAP